MRRNTATHTPLRDVVSCFEKPQNIHKIKITEITNVGEDVEKNGNIYALLVGM